MNATSTLHVILGSGAIGRATALALLRRGKQVRLVNRSGKMADQPAGAQVVAGDVNDPASVRQLTAGAAVVYMCAQPAYTQWPEKFPPMLAAVIEGVAASGARLVLADNLYMYGDPAGRPIHAGMPMTAHTRKGAARKLLAEMLLEAHRAGKLQATMGRGSDYFGPFGVDSSMGGRVFYPLLAGKSAQLVGNIDLPHTHTYTGDFGEALAILGENDAAYGRAWIVPNDQPQITQRQFITLAAEIAGVPAKVSSMGALMMRLGGLFIPEAREMVEMMYEFEKPFVVDSSEFERAFGMRPTPLKQALAETIAWYRTHPEAGHAG
jgi:nucleoside-diphosphate-sugar epimerase